MGKLFVIQARDVPQSVVIRRGPSAWYHLVSWNTNTDEMQHGAWIKGRIYEDKCDLSPDGQLFLYFVLKESGNDIGLPNTWTALSRPPWLKALVIWPHGDTYNGGGWFTGNREIVLRPTSTHFDPLRQAGGMFAIQTFPINLYVSIRTLRPNYIAAPTLSLTPIGRDTTCLDG